MKNTTLKELAEKLNGKYWEKEDKKRVYLDKGHNTKKMKTTTYVCQLDNGDFKVCCYIDCPSQDRNWIKSQQQQIIESVEEDLFEIKYEMYFLDYSVNNCEHDWYFELPNGDKLYNLYGSYDSKIDIDEQKIYRNYNPKHKHCGCPTISDLIKSGVIKDVKK